MTTTLYNVRADYKPAPGAASLDDALDALADLHVSITEHPDGARSFTLSLPAPDAWQAATTATHRLAAVGAERAGLVALDVLTSEAFDAREGLGDVVGMK